jgi:transcriptional regulator with XRE-family HTH domain
MSSNQQAKSEVIVLQALSRICGSKRGGSGMKGAHTLEELRAELCKDEEFKKEYRRQRPYYDILVDVIKRRNELGLTQKELAKRANTTQSCIARIESGEHNVRMSTLINIADALESSVDVHLVAHDDEGDYTDLFTAKTSTATQKSKEEYTAVTMDYSATQIVTGQQR